MTRPQPHQRGSFPTAARRLSLIQLKRRGGLPDALAGMRRALHRHTLVIAGLACLLLAAPSLAANVVHVRVGDHPTFTRVVFELDAPAGYRIEKAADQGTQELIVTLEAASSPHSVRSGSPEVGLVTVQQGANLTLAHIRLRGANAGVKELILSDPPRIVIDLMREPSRIAAAKATVAKPAAVKVPEAKAPEAKTAEPKPPVVAVKPLPEPLVTPKPTAKPGVVPEMAKLEAKPAQLPVTPKPEVKSTPPALAPPPVAPKLEAKATLPPLEPVPAVKPAESAVAPKPETKLAQTPVAPQPEVKAVPVMSPGHEEAPAPPPPTAPPEIAKAAPPEIPVPAQAETPPMPGLEPEATAKPPLPEPAAEAIAKPFTPVPTAKTRAAEPAATASWFGLEPMQLAALGGGVLLLVFLVLMLMRRRRLPNDLDVTALVDEDEDEAPPASISEGLDFRAGERETARASVQPRSAPERLTQTQTQTPPIAAPADLFGDTDQDLFDTPEKGENKMSQDTLDLPVSRSQRPTPAQTMPTSSAGDSDVVRLVRELERRLAQVETRLDEANDARERLERQVAAQSEELRVQRAAIARTQRALRGLNRGEEEQATEPALRDPNRPMGGN